MARVALVVVAAALLCWLSVAIAYSFVAGRKQPAAALKLWPLSSVARTGLAERLAAADRGRAGESARWARAALTRDPVNAVAARQLGLAMALSGDEDGAARAFAYAARLSRRDLPTQLWLIEDAVRRGEVTQALRHYDLALRVGGEADTLLLPVLVKAADDPTVAPRLAELLRRRPSWRMRFADQLIYDGLKTPGQARLIPVLGLDLGRPVELDLLRRALDALVGSGRLAEAAALHRSVVPGSNGGLRNGDFSRENSLPPFDWRLVDEPGLAAVVDASRSPPVLLLTAAPGRGGEVAKQLISLPSGSYTIQLRFGNVQGPELSRPLIGVTCVGAEATALSLRLPSAPERGRTARQAFTVPSGCLHQWLSITIGRSFDDRDLGEPWLTDLRVRRSQPA